MFTNMKQCTKSVAVLKKDPTCISILLDTSEEEEVEDVVFKHFPTRRRKIKPTRRTTFHKLHPSTTLLPLCEYDDYDDEDDSNANIRILVMADNPDTRGHSTIQKKPTTKEIPEICKTKSKSTFGKEVSLLQTNLLSATKEYSTKQITYQSEPHKGYKRSTLNESSTPRSTEVASKHSTLVLKVSLHDNHTLYNKSSTTAVTVSRKKLTTLPKIKIANKKFNCNQSKVTTSLTKPISSSPTTLTSGEVDEFHNKSSKQHSTATTIYLASPKKLRPVKVHHLGKVIKPSRRPLMTFTIPTSTSAKILTLQSNHTSAKILTLQSNYTSAEILTLQSNHTSAKILTLQSNYTSANILTLQSNPTKQVETHTEDFTEPVTNPYASTIIPLLFQRDKMKQVSTESSTETETNNKFSPLQMALTLQSNQMEQMKSNTEFLINITTKNPLSSLNQVEEVTSNTECSTMAPENSLISLLKMLALTENKIEEMKSSTECSSGTRVCLPAPYLSSPMKGITTLTTKDQLKKCEQSSKEAYATTGTPGWNSAFRIFASLIKKVHMEGMEALVIQTQSPAIRANSKLNGSSSQMPFGETARKVQSGEIKLVSQYSPATRTNFLTGHSPKTSTTNTKNKLPYMNIYSSPGLNSHRTTTFLENNSTLLENNSTFSVKLPSQSIQKSISEKDKYSGIEQHSNTTRLRNGLTQIERSTTTRKRYSIIEKFLHKKGRSVLAMMEYPVKHRLKRSVDNMKKAPSEKSTKTKLLALDFTKQIPEMREDITLPTLRPLPLEVTEDFSNDLEYDRDPVLDFDTENSDDLLDEMEMITPEETKFTPKSRLPVSRHFEVESETIPIRHNTMESSWPVSQPPQATRTQIARRLKVNVSSNIHISKGNHQLKEKFDEYLRSVPDRYIHTHAMMVPSDLLVPYAIIYPEDMSENLKTPPYKAFRMNTIYPVETTQVNNQPALDTKLNMFSLVNNMVKNALENKAAETPETVVMVITVKNENNVTDRVITPASEVIMNISEDVRYHNRFETYHPEVINKEMNATVINNPETFVTSTPEVSMNFVGLRSPVHYTFTTSESAAEVPNNLPYLNSSLGLSSPVHYTFTTSESAVEVPNNLPYLNSSLGLSSPAHYTFTTSESSVEVPKNLPYLNSSLHNTLIIIGPEVARNLAYLHIPLNNTSITSDREITQDKSDLNNTFNTFSSTYRKYSEPAKDLSGLKMLHFNAFLTSAPEVVAKMPDLKHPFHKASMISVPEVAKNFSDLKSSFQKISLMSAPKISNNFSYFWRPLQNISIAPVQEVGKNLYGSMGPFLTTATIALPLLRNLESSNVNLMNISKVMLAPQPETHMAFFPFAIKTSELNGSKNSKLSAADQNLMTSSIAKEYKCNFTTKAKSTASDNTHVKSQTSQQTKSTVTSGKLTRKISLLNVPYFKGEDEEDNVNDYTVYTHSPTHTKTTAKSKTHYKTQTSSIVSSTTTSQRTSVSSSIGKFHIRTTLLYPNQSATSTTVTGRKESKRSMTTASEPTGNMLKCISIESVIQNKSLQISTPSTPIKSTEKTYSAASINTTYIASSSIVVPPKSLSEGLMKDKAVKPSSRPSILVSRSVSEVNCSEVSTNGAQDTAGIQIMLPKSLITDWLIQSKTHEPPQVSECHYSNVSKNSAQTLSSAPVVLIQNKTVEMSQTISKSVAEYHSSEIPPSSNVTCHLINITQGTFSSPEMVSVTDKCASELMQMKTMLISQSSSSATSKPVSGFHPSEVLTTPALNVPSVNTRIPEYHSSEIPPSCNVPYHLMNITQAAVGSLQTASVTLPECSLTDNQVLIQNKTVEMSQTISKSVAEYHSSEIPPSSNITHHLINITQAAFSSLQTASVTLTECSLTDNQVLIQNKTVEMSQTISKSVAEYHSSEIPPSSNVTYHLINITQGAFSSPEMVSVTDKCASELMQMKTMLISQSSSSATSKPVSGFHPSEVLTTPALNVPSVNTRIPEYHSSEISPSSNVTQHLINITQGAFSSLQTASVTLPECSLTDNQVLIQNKTVEMSQTISKSVAEYHSSEIPPSSNVTYHLINITQGAFSSPEMVSVTDKCASELMQMKTMLISQSSSSATSKPVSGFHPSEVLTTPALNVPSVNTRIPEYHSSEISPSSNVTQHLINITQGAFSSLQTASVTLPECSLTDNQVLIQNKTVEMSQTISKSVAEYHSSEIPPSSNVTYHLINITQGAFSSPEMVSVTDKCASELMQMKTMLISQSSSSATSKPVSGFHPSEVLTTPALNVPSVNTRIPEYHSSEISPSSNVTQHLINITQGAFSSLQTASVTLPECSLTYNQVLIQNKTVEMSQTISKSVLECHSSEIPPSNVTCHLINITQGAFSSSEMVSVTDKCASELIQMKTMLISQSSSSATSKPVSEFHPSEVLTTPALNVPSVNTRIPEYHSSEIPPSSNVTHHLINITQGAFSSLQTASVTDKCASTQVLMPISQHSSSATSKRVSRFHPSEVLTAPAFNIPSGNITHQPVSETLQVITQKSSQFQSGLPTSHVNGILKQTNTTCMPVSQPSQKELSPSSSVTYKEPRKEERTTLPSSESQKISITQQEVNIKLGSSNFPVPVSESMTTDTCISYEMIMRNKTAKITTQLSSLVTFKELCKEERTTLPPSEAQRKNMTVEEMNRKLTSANFPVTTPESMVTDECISLEMVMQDKTEKITSSSSAVISKAISEQKPPEICTTPCQMVVQRNQIPVPSPGIPKVIGQPNQKMSFRASVNNSVTNKILVQNNEESDSDKALVQNSQMPFPAMTFIPVQEQKSKPPPVDIPAIYIVTESIFNSIINELVNKNKMTHKGTSNKMLIQNSAVKDPDQHKALTPTVYILKNNTPRNKNNEIVTRNKMKNAVNNILKQTFTSQKASPFKPIWKPHIQKISTLLAHGAPPVNIATARSDEILILSKPAWLGHQILIQNNTTPLPLSRYSVPLQPVQQSHQAGILRESSFGAPTTNIFEATRKKIPIQNNTTSKFSNLKNGMIVDNVNKWINKEIMKLKAALPYKSATKENMDITSLPDDVQKCLSKEIMVHLPSQSSSVVTDFSHLKQESVPDNTVRIKMTGIPYTGIMHSVVPYPLSPGNVTTKKTATVSIKHATYYDEEDEEPDELLSGLSVTLEEIETRKKGSRSRHSLNPPPEIISSPSYITIQSSSPEKFQGIPVHILQLPLRPTAAFPYKENHLPLFYIPHIPFNLLNVATPSSLYANETTPLVLILIPGSMQAEPWMTHQSSLSSTTEFTKYKTKTKQTEASVLLNSLLPTTTKSTRCKTGTTMNINSQKSHTTETLTKTTPSSKETLKPGFITNILGSTISLTLHNRTKLTSCPSHLTSKEMHEEALEHSVPSTTDKISLSETLSAKIKLQSTPSTTTRSKYARNKSSTTKTTAKPKKLTTVNINKISSNVDKCISHLTTMGNNVYRSSKPPHSFTEIIYNRLEEDEDEEPGSTLISVPLTTAKIMIEPKSHKRVKRTSALTTYYVKSPVKIMIMTDDENNLSNAEVIENLIHENAEGEPLREKLDNVGDLKKKRYFIYLEKDKPNVTFSKSSNPLHMCSVDGVMDDFSSYALHDPSHFIQVIENYNCSKYIALPGQIKLTNEARPRMVRRGGYEAQELSRNSVSVNEADLQSIISTSQVTQTDNQMFMFPGSSAVISCQGSSRKMQPQDTPNMMYRWKREDGQEISGQHSWETAYGELCLNNVGAEDAGKYVCHSSSFNPNSEKVEEHSFTHHISVVLLPKYLHQVMVHYHAEPTCEDIDVDLLKLFLPEIVGEHLCGSRELCRVEVVQPYCYRGMRGEMYLSLTVVIRDAALYSLLPVLNETFCGMTCKGKADAKFVLLMNQNLAAFFKSPIHSRLSYRSANFTPVESSFSSRMVTGCRGGFQLKQGFCEPCPADWYSEEDSAQCNKCGAGKYQPRPGSSMCLKCPHPFAAKKCLSLFHQQYAYMAMALVSLLIVKILLLYLGMQFCKPFLLWYKRQKERKSIPGQEIQPWVRTGYPESRRSRRREERHLRASRSQLYYYQPLPEEEGGCTCKRQSYRRSSKHKIPPKPPPPDFI